MVPPISMEEMEGPPTPPDASPRVRANASALQKIDFPKEPSDENLRLYVAQIIEISQNQTTYTPSDPQIGMLTRLGEEHIQILLDALKSNNPYNFHLLRAIDRLSTEKSKPQILASLSTAPSLAEILLKNSWQNDARETLIQGLHQEFLPEDWLRAVASFEDPSTYDALIQHMVHGLNPASTYEVVENLPGIQLDDAVDKTWQRSKHRHGWQADTFAIIAIGYGKVDALEHLIHVLDSRKPDQEYLKDQALQALIEHTTAHGSTEEIRAWYQQNRDHLVFDSADKKFKVKS